MVIIIISNLVFFFFLKHTTTTADENAEGDDRFLRGEDAHQEPEPPGAGRPREAAGPGLPDPEDGPPAGVFGKGQAHGGAVLGEWGHETGERRIVMMIGDSFYLP